MQIEEDFFGQFLLLLNEHKVEAMVIGGYAVNVHGYSRFTGDLDIWYNPTQENIERLISCIEKYGYDTDILKEEELINSSPIKLQNEGLKIELIASIKGVDSFEEAMKNTLKVNVGSMLFPFIGYRDLINNKKSSMRMKDAVDVHYLEKIKNINNQDSSS